MNSEHNVLCVNQNKIEAVVVDEVHGTCLSDSVSSALGMTYNNEPLLTTNKEELELTESNSKAWRVETNHMVAIQKVLLAALRSSPDATK
ncbi:unnamed protein product [Sphenostylis stenocarpa]|uniref:Uncharacterized protein n=1 Tax=Sphenostylis stenocarpa TaxID=92480 RepID=A0AA86SFB5_9FABA|nr:unnamed protein product [Sphenostylis stenocarpa]